MLVTLVDDSIPFNGLTPSTQPLGGAEKGFAALAGALVRRGHVVRAINRTPHAVNFADVSWVPWEGRRPPITEVLIAFRKPSLLQFTRATKARILWLTRPAGYLEKGGTPPILERVEPTLVFLGTTHRGTFEGESPRRTRVIIPGVSSEYVEADEMVPANPPFAVVTTHPLHGLDWLVKRWVEAIRPEVPEAELRVYSATLKRAEDGKEVPERLKPVCEQVLAAREHGVVVREPEADPQMADAFRAARVHLYPGSSDEMYCATLAESQACGLPAVARPLGAVSERIVDGETGHIAPDDDAFAKLACQLLRDDEMFEKLSQGARKEQRWRTWDTAASEFESLFR